MVEKDFDIETYELKPQGPLCCNCAFCQRRFMGNDGYCCELRRKLVGLSGLEYSEYQVDISNIYTTSCKCFTSQANLKALEAEDSLEKLEIMQSLGKFERVPAIIIEMRKNWFLDRGDATYKQFEYSAYLSRKHKRFVPAKIDGYGYGRLKISRCADKQIMRSWIGELMPSLKTQMM